MKRLHVMAAVIRRADGRILIARRADNAHQGGLWEFPGGKLESGEARLAGLTRELQEELGIQVSVARPLIDIRHDYPDKSIRLDVWLVENFTGEAHGAEGQPIRWVSAEELSEYDFPEANHPIVQAAQLPERYLITPDGLSLDAIEPVLARLPESDKPMIQLRHPSLAPEKYHGFATKMLAKHADKARWLLKGDQPPQQGQGWHLTANQLRQLHAAGWRRKPYPSPPRPQEDQVPIHPTDWQGLLAASCHSAEELHMAGQIGVDFATLSPVLPTGSHPDAQPLGWEMAADLIAQVNYPVYLLGGMDNSMLEKAFAIGAQGIAGISGLWPKT